VTEVVGSWRRSSHSGNESNCVELTWRKSSRSANESNCVEVSHTLDAVRDSKNPAGPILRAAGLSSFVLAAKAGRFDR
jgi:hypothetical protein